jgi:hypothetical protein
MKLSSDIMKAETTWFHIFRAMVDSGDLAKMSGTTLKVYFVIKAHVNFATGVAFPSEETIARKSGISLSQTKRELKALEKIGYVWIGKIGRKNQYRLREKFEIQNDEGKPIAIATWDYLPNFVQHAVADLKNVLVTGDLAGARIVHIERLQVQIVQGEGNTGVMIQEADLDKMFVDNPELLRAILSARARSREKEGEKLLTAHG